MHVLQDGMVVSGSYYTPEGCLALCGRFLCLSCVLCALAPTSSQYGVAVHCISIETMYMHSV